MQTAFKSLMNTDQHFRQAKTEKLGILNLIREYLMKQDTITRWKQLRFKEIFKRKGFAIVKMMEVLTQITYKMPF